MYDLIKTYPNPANVLLISSLTLSSLKLPLSSSSTTICELLSQISTCSDEDDSKCVTNEKKDTVINQTFHENIRSKHPNGSLKGYFFGSKAINHTIDVIVSTGRVIKLKR